MQGKMIAAQSIVVASTATRWYGYEGDILRSFLSQPRARRTRRHSRFSPRVCVYVDGRVVAESLAWQSPLVQRDPGG
jgi:hypothetical protein